MCLSMQVIGAPTTLNMVLGIIIGLIGIFAIIINYQLYRKILNNSKKKYAFDIMQLAKEISED